MLKNEREREILNIIKTKGGFVTVKELCTKIYASESSIRRSLSSLENQGIISRTYGGAELLTNLSGVINFAQRAHHNVESKIAIAKKAAKIIRDGSIVFLDQSSTAIYLANEIKDRNSLTVVTNNTEILRLMSETRIKTFCSGGFLSRENRNCLIGGDACRTFENMYADYVFFSTKSISDEGIISDCDREEVIVRNAMLANAEYKVFLCGSEKFGKRSPYRQCGVDEISCMVSDEAEFEQYSKFGNKIKLL